jgi:hypothetical protein
LSPCRGYNRRVCQAFVNDRPVLSSERRPTSIKQQPADSNKSLVLGPRWGLTPRLTGQLTIDHNVTLTLTEVVVRQSPPDRGMVGGGVPIVGSCCVGMPSEDAENLAGAT